MDMYDGVAVPEPVDGAEEAAALAVAYPFVLRYFRSLSRDPAAAEDLTQETFLRARHSRAALRDPEAHLAWLYRIATRLYLDRLRQRARRPVAADVAPEELDLPDAGRSLERLVERDEMSDCVRAYLAELPDGYRTVLLLHDEHGLSAPQIATLLGLSLPTVKIRLHRGRAKLRAALEAGCDFGHDERAVLVCEPRG